MSGEAEVSKNWFFFTLHWEMPLANEYDEVYFVSTIAVPSLLRIHSRRSHATSTRAAAKKTDLFLVLLLSPGAYLK